MQSDRGSDDEDSSPSCPISELEEEENLPDATEADRPKQVAGGAEGPSETVSSKSEEFVPTRNPEVDERGSQTSSTPISPSHYPQSDGPRQCNMSIQTDDDNESCAGTSRTSIQSRSEFSAGIPMSRSHDVMSDSTTAGWIVLECSHHLSGKVSNIDFKLAMSTIAPLRRKRRGPHS